MTRAGEGAEPGGGAPPPGPCANCGAEVAERYCSRCGQDRGLTPHVPLRELVGEALGEALSIDGRMARTVGPFLLRPGFLTAEFLAGRRVRYSSPLRLYLLTTLLFFLAASTGDGVHLSTSPGGSAAVRLGKGDGQVGFSVTTQGAGIGPGIAAAGGADVHDPSPEAQAKVDRELGQLRATNAAGRLLADRLDLLRHLPPEEASRRLGQGLLQQAPRVLFFLVPVMAGLLALLFRRPRRFYAEHFVFALHLHALGFAVLLPGELLDSRALTGAGVGAAALHLLLGLRRVYGRPWPGTLLRFGLLSLLYLLALGIGLTFAVLLAVALL